jgi:hypothetical protein
MNTAYTNPRVVPQAAENKVYSFHVVADRAPDKSILARVDWHQGSTCHIQTETEARCWAQLFAGAEGLLRVCQEYIRRCEADEIRGNGMYAAMLTAIKQATKPE